VHTSGVPSREAGVVFDTLGQDAQLTFLNARRSANPSLILVGGEGYASVLVRRVGPGEGVLANTAKKARQVSHPLQLAEPDQHHYLRRP
jgi:hypothetical protein